MGSSPMSSANSKKWALSPFFIFVKPAAVGMSFFLTPAITHDILPIDWMKKAGECDSSAKSAPSL